MSEKMRKNAPTTRGRPFQKGNPGRPHGARHKTTLAVEALLSGDAEGLTRKAIEMGLAGDVTAPQIVFGQDRPRQERDAYLPRDAALGRCGQRCCCDCDNRRSRGQR
jgi:hypothetical protein